MGGTVDICKCVFLRYKDCTIEARTELLDGVDSRQDLPSTEHASLTFPKANKLCTILHLEDQIETGSLYTRYTTLTSQWAIFSSFS